MTFYAIYEGDIVTTRVPDSRDDVHKCQGLSEHNDHGRIRGRSCLSAGPDWITSNRMAALFAGARETPARLPPGCTESRLPALLCASYDRRIFLNLKGKSVSIRRQDTLCGRHAEGRKTRLLGGLQAGRIEHLAGRVDDDSLVVRKRCDELQSAVDAHHEHGCGKRIGDDRVGPDNRH